MFRIFSVMQVNFCYSIVFYMLVFCFKFFLPFLAIMRPHPNGLNQLSSKVQSITEEDMLKKVGSLLDNPM